MNRTVTVTRGSGLLEGFLARKRASKANSLLKRVEKERILDIGCGSYPYFLITSNFKYRFGMDPSLESLSLENIDLRRIDATKIKLPFEDNYFDAVTMLAVFEHINSVKLDFVLKEIKRVLKKDGLLVITTPAPWSDKLLHFMAKIKLISSEEIHEHKHNHPKAKIIDIIKVSGFDGNKIESGFFELKMNMWFTAKK